MVAPNDIGDLRAAWRALAGTDEREGWQTIPVTVRGPCSLSAAKRMPHGEEAILIEFHGSQSPPESKLPQGHGFEVLRLAADRTGREGLLLALVRRPKASLDLFALMTQDLVVLLDDWEVTQEEALLRRFIERIRAWQDFMNRHREGVLSAEAELGLFGELVMLDRMTETSLPRQDLVDSWQGPNDGLQDFILGDGGIEVKTTLASGGFPATVSSLDQLDDNLRQPLFVAATRLAIHSSGLTLPEMANVVREHLGDDGNVLETFDIRLMQAGLLASALHRYTKRFRYVSSAILRVRGEFPRLTRANVPPLVTRARYEIDLALAAAEEVELAQALKTIGVT